MLVMNSPCDLPRQLIRTWGDESVHPFLLTRGLTNFGFGTPERAQQEWTPVLRPNSLYLFNMERFLYANRIRLRSKTL